MPSNAGARDQRLQFQQATRVKGNMGGETDTWANVGAVCFGKVGPLSAREALAIQRNEPRSLYKVEIRNRRDIQADWRIIWVSNGNKILILRDTGDAGPRPTERILIAEEAGSEMTL